MKIGYDLRMRRKDIGLQLNVNFIMKVNRPMHNYFLYIAKINNK
jgi:hypothetical protein